MLKHIIKDMEDNTMVSSIYLGRRGNFLEAEVNYTKDTKHALVFETADEANSCITFIGDVIDWEQEQRLEFAEINL